MSDITLSFQCEDYLRQWFINQNGGTSPVRLKKNTPESNCLQFALRSKSESDPVPEIKGEPLVVFIPSFRFKNPKDFNHITATGRRCFISILRMRFDEQIWYDMHSVYDFGIRKDEMIYAWMESHGIDLTEKNYNAVAKRLQRLRERTLTKVRVRNFRKNSKKRE